MSTKTTFKRVALVTVAALGFGVLTSVAPSQATTYSDSLVLSATTASQLTGETATSTSVVAALTYLADAATDSMSVTATLVSAPAGNTSLPMLKLTETTTASAESPLTSPLLLTATSGVAANIPVFVIPAGFTTAMNVTAKLKVYMNAPSKVGTYVVKLTPAITSGSGSMGSAAQTVTITVATNPALDTVATSATVLLGKGETITSTADEVVTNTKSTTSGLAAATISVGLLNAGGFATTSESYTATVTGPGTLGSGTAATTMHYTSIGRAITVKAGNNVQLFPDGTSGVATVTINSAAGALLATKKVTFYGSTTALTATVVKPVIGFGTPTLGTILVTAADSAGTEVQDAKINVFSSATTIISNAYTACAAYSATNGTVKSPGYLCSVTGVKAGTATITPTTLTSATDTTAGAVSGTGVSIRVGSTSPASVSVTTDKAAYIPGEKATVTVVLLDKDGLTVADGDYTHIFATGGIAANYTLGAGSDTTSATSVLGFASGVTKYTVFMPVAETTVKFTWTTDSVASGAGTGLATANQAVDGAISVVVASSSASAATDAAMEATDAANAATDAANAAAEAADAATAAAQDAADAVATLSTQVAELISALKAQITSLTNLVIKIQKKVKA